MLRLAEAAKLMSAQKQPLMQVLGAMDDAIRVVQVLESRPQACARSHGFTTATLADCGATSVGAAPKHSTP